MVGDHGHGHDPDYYDVHLFVHANCDCKGGQAKCWCCNLPNIGRSAGTTGAQALSSPRVRKQVL